LAGDAAVDTFRAGVIYMRCLQDAALPSGIYTTENWNCKGNWASEMVNRSRIVGRTVGSADEKRTLAEKMEIGLSLWV
jgi:hypothetical protein